MTDALRRSFAVQSKASSVKDYLEEVPQERRPAFERLRAAIRDNLPAGFEETMQYGMISYVVPKSLYPAGYHCDPSLPLPFLSLASQKNYIALYHMALYADPALLEWFTDAFAKASRERLDLGKSCLRFKKPESIPTALLGELCSKMDPGDWIRLYEEKIKR